MANMKLQLYFSYLQIGKKKSLSDLQHLLFCFNMHSVVLVLNDSWPVHQYSHINISGPNWSELLWIIVAILILISTIFCFWIIE